MTVVLDSGALIAVERRDRLVGPLLRLAQAEHIPVRTSAAAVAQVWRGGARHANLARVIAGVDAAALDLHTGKVLGTLLGRAGTADVVDAHVASLAEAGDTVLTSDPDDLVHLLDARGVSATVRKV